MQLKLKRNKRKKVLVELDEDLVNELDEIRHKEGCTRVHLIEELLKLAITKLEEK